MCVEVKLFEGLMSRSVTVNTKGSCLKHDYLKPYLRLIYTICLPKLMFMAKASKSMIGLFVWVIVWTARLVQHPRNFHITN